MLRLLALVLVGLAALAAGCGSGDEEQEPQGGSSQAATQPEVTRDEYIKSADAFCKEANAEAKTINARIERVAGRTESDEETLAAIAPLLEDGYKTQRERLREFKAIEPPAADKPTIEKLWTAREEGTALVGRLADAAAAGDVGRFTSLSQEQERVGTRAKALAQGYGFTECGSGSNEAD